MLRAKLNFWKIGSEGNFRSEDSRTKFEFWSCEDPSKLLVCTFYELGWNEQELWKGFDWNSSRIDWWCNKQGIGNEESL